MGRGEKGEEGGEERRVKGGGRGRTREGEEGRGRTFVGQVEESVVRRGGGAPLLLRAKDQVDPQVQAGRDQVGLECGALDATELVRRALGPRRQHDVAHDGAVLRGRESGRRSREFAGEVARGGARGSCSPCGKV